MGELLDRFRTRSDAAIVDAVGPMSWAELDDRVAALQGHLESIGLPVDATVVLVSTNRREVVEVELACLQGGWACVPVNWYFDADGVARVLADVGSGVLVVDPVLLGLAVGALERCANAASFDVLVLDGGIGTEGRPDGFADYEVSIEDAAGRPAPPPSPTPGTVVFYTSGTTGRSRGVRLSSTATSDASPVLRHFRPALAAAGIPADGRTLLCGPHYHWAQWTFGVLPLLNGSTLVIQPRFVPTNVLSGIDQHAITNVMLLPTQFVRMLRLHADVRGTFSGSELQRVVHGAAPCRHDIKRAMIAWWGPILTEYYGATEGGVATLISSEEWLERPGSVGRALAHREITVVADDGSTAMPGSDGVVHVRSLDGLDIEYVGAPVATSAARALPGHVTFGDIGHLDVDGYLFLSDRRSDMIVCGGVNVSSGDVEAVLLSHPAVADAAAFGVPDPTAGESVRVAVQLAAGTIAPDGATEREAAIAAVADELLEYCRERLAAHQRPVAVDVVDQLPRTASGKLVKRHLRSRFWEPDTAR